MDKSKMEEYRKFLIELVSDDNERITKQVQIQLAIKKRFGIDIKQSKLSKDLKKFKIILKNSGVDRVYRYDPNAFEENNLPDEFYKYSIGQPILIKNMQVLRIPVKRDTEIAVCNALTEYFKNGNIICIPAYKSVCIISSKKYVEKLSAIKETISEEYEKKKKKTHKRKK